MWNITTKALLHLGVVLVVDVFFHYLYILTIPSDMKLVTKLSDWCLGELDTHLGGVSKETVHAQNQTFSSSSWNCLFIFSMSCSSLEMLAAEISIFTQIQSRYIVLVMLKAQVKYTKSMTFSRNWNQLLQIFHRPCCEHS